MKFYLSSYKLGSNPSALAGMVSQNNKKVAYIPNALDYSDDYERRKTGEKKDIEQLRGLGLDVELVDLRRYFVNSVELEKRLNKVGLIWVRGGNCFVLRQAMKLSGFDKIIKKLLKKPDLVYGGYSAGICVLNPTLKGLDIMDDPNQMPYGIHPIIWKGLSLINYSIVPHYNSDHPESAKSSLVAKYLKKNKIPFKTLKDGDVIIVK